MKAIVQFSAREELKALPILLRDSPGVVLPDRTYLISVDTARRLRDAGVRFTEVSREGSSPLHEGVLPG